MTSALTPVICVSAAGFHEATFTGRQLRWRAGAKRKEGVWISKGKWDTLLTRGIQECCRITVLMQISFLNTHTKLNFHKYGGLG